MCDVHHLLPRTQPTQLLPRVLCFALRDVDPDDPRIAFVDRVANGFTIDVRAGRAGKAMPPRALVCAGVTALLAMNIAVFIIAGSLTSMRLFFGAPAFSLCASGHSLLGFTGSLSVGPNPSTILTYTVDGTLLMDTDTTARLAAARAAAGAADTTCMVSLLTVAPPDADSTEVLPAIIAQEAVCLATLGTNGGAKIVTQTLTAPADHVTLEWRALTFSAQLETLRAQALNVRDASSTAFATPHTLLALAHAGVNDTALWVQMTTC